MRIVHDVGALLAPGGAWESLWAQAGATVFQSAPWMRACVAVAPAGRRHFAVWDGVGAGLFEVDANGARWVGTGSSDYLDFLVAPGPDRDARVVRLCRAALRECPTVDLPNLVDETGTVAALLSARGVFATVVHEMSAPTMDASAAPEALRKKSLRRHENKLRRRGWVATRHLTTAAEIAPRLDPFFTQHRARWAGSPYPSLFHDPRQRALYRALVRELSGSGWLRFTEVHLDGAVVAAHLGFVQGGRYYWYKPCFDPALAHLSPGEVLLKHLIERAVEEAVAEFDFTIGDEPFKQRFATRSRTVRRLHVTRSRAAALALRCQLKVRRAAAAAWRRWTTRR